MQCWSDRADTHTRVVIGDSKGKAVFYGLTHSTLSQPGWFYLGGNAKDGAPVPQPQTGAAQFQNAFDRVVDLIDGMPQVRHVVLAVATRSLYGLMSDDSIMDLASRSNEQQKQVQDAVHQALFKLAQHQRQVDVVLDNPTFWHPTRCVSRKTGWAGLDAYFDEAKPGCSMSLDTHLERSRIYRDMMSTVQKQLAAQNLDVRIVDTVPVLCELESRRCEMTHKGRYLYDFTDHTSGYGSVRVAEFLLQSRIRGAGPDR